MEDEVEQGSKNKALITRSPAEAKTPAIDRKQQRTMHLTQTEGIQWDQEEKLFLQDSNRKANQP